LTIAVTTNGQNQSLGWVFLNIGSVCNMMETTAPYFSTQPDSMASVGDIAVYHDDFECVVGAAIDDRYFASGTGNRPLCPICRRLAREADGKGSTTAVASRHT
jgi:hypothetical protein